MMAAEPNIAQPVSFIFALSTGVGTFHILMNQSGWIIATGPKMTQMILKIDSQIITFSLLPR
jgi:hypothetical protein